MTAALSTASAPRATAREGDRAAWARWSLRSTATAFLLVFVILPLAAVVRTVWEDGWQVAWEALCSPVALSALWLTLWTALAVAAINAVFGTATAWVLVRYRFPGRGLLNGLIDLPFAIPTLVTGLMLVVLYGPQQLVGHWLAQHGVRLLFAPLGIVLSLLFVTFPVVVRAVEPVLMEIDADQEEAAETLGASPVRVLGRIVVPALGPAVVSSTLLTFTRALSEFGSVVMVAGNLPRRTLTAPVYVFGAVESGEPGAAAAMSLLLIGLSALLVFLVDWASRRRALRLGLLR